MISTLTTVLTGSLMSIFKAFVTENIIRLIVLRSLENLTERTDTSIDDEILEEVRKSLDKIDVKRVKKSL
ncbi:hypothetical protein [Limisalsivibrio acetivorans]|uniref:hypothetical protein n=1 Tax=Limisalsivibrio acetivorans TaxID=1304888 RepID=UPI0003B31E3E|nr:hypothetical protein [Limisalsivibrio acetivorans]